MKKKLVYKLFIDGIIIHNIFFLIGFGRSIIRASLGELQCSQRMVDLINKLYYYEQKLFFFIWLNQKPKYAGIWLIPIGPIDDYKKIISSMDGEVSCDWLCVLFHIWWI